MAGTIRIQLTGESYTFDSTLNEQRDRTAEVTRHPVGALSVATDHRQQDPLELTATLRLTETPFLDQVNTTSQTIQAALQGGGTVVVDDRVEGGPPRILEAEDFLERASKQLVTWVSPRYGVYENMLIERVSEPVERPKHVDFAVDMVQVELALAELVDLPPEVVPKPTLKPEKDAGPQTLADKASGFFDRDANSTSYAKEAADDAGRIFNVNPFSSVDEATQ